MLPWFFIYDHVNYARWGSIYLHDIIALPETAKEVYEEFMKGNFVVKETKKTFNEISPDLALEHVNKDHKVAGGLIGITRTETARDRWCITFNARSELVNQAKHMCGLETENVLEETFNKSDLKKDESDVQKLAQHLTKCKMFQSGNDKITNIFTGETASDDITTDLLTARARGQNLANVFYSERLVHKKVDFYAPLKKNRSKTFKDLYKLTMAAKSKNKEVLVDAEKFVRQMFSAVKNGRDIDLTSILKHELRVPPPALFDQNGQLRQCVKSVLADILKKKVDVMDSLQIEDRSKTMKILDGQALIQAIGKPKTANTFGDLKDVFLKTIAGHLKDCQSLQVIFDQYKQCSIKSGTRVKRAKVTPVEYKITSSDTPLPKKWERFIHHPKNKANLTDFISEAITEKAKTVSNGCELLTAGGFKNELKVTTNFERDTVYLQSDHEEGDTRFILHAIDAAQQGYETAIIYSRDTDVLLLLIHHFELLPTNVWVQSGTAKSPKFVAVHEIVQNLGDEKNSLLAYHAITGCDTTSAFAGLSKKTGWQVLLQNHALLQTFGCSAYLSENEMKRAEKFVIALYSHRKQNHKEYTDVDQLRATMFPKINSLEKLPPTSEALGHHLRRANFQTYVWKIADKTIQALPSPESLGWHLKDDDLVPVTSLQSPISIKDLELVACQCKSGCRTARCSCVKNHQKCMKDVCHVDKDICFNQYNFDDTLDS